MKNVYIDCRNLSCPMPIVKVAKAMKDLAPGDCVEVVATDPAFKPDIEAWIRKTGNVLEDFRQEEGNRVAVVRKS
jgi:TusA-related sulfurtransferase